MIYIEEKFYKVWLSLINNLNLNKYLDLINFFKSNKNIFNATKKDLQKVLNIDYKLIYELLNLEKRQSVKNYLNYMESYKIDIISFFDKEYPISLKEIYSPPKFLYIKGNKSIFNNLNIGIVGCRDCSTYGKEVAKKIAFDLASNNVNIVSGLARGIDTYSHIGAICANGLTTAVLGSGINVIYPKENLDLNGAIISEYPLGTSPRKQNFPARNRIISGISKGIVVIESKLKGGSLITANFALEQNRDVFAVPRKY